MTQKRCTYSNHNALALRVGALAGHALALALCSAIARRGARGCQVSAARGSGLVRSRASLVPSLAARLLLLLRLGVEVGSRTAGGAVRVVLVLVLVLVVLMLGSRGVVEVGRGKRPGVDGVAALGGASLGGVVDSVGVTRHGGWLVSRCTVCKPGVSQGVCVFVVSLGGGARDVGTGWDGMWWMFALSPITDQRSERKGKGTPGEKLGMVVEERLKTRKGMIAVTPTKRSEKDLSEKSACVCIPCVLKMMMISGREGKPAGTRVSYTFYPFPQRCRPSTPTSRWA